MHGGLTSGIEFDTAHYGDYESSIDFRLAKDHESGITAVKALWKAIGASDFRHLHNWALRIVHVITKVIKAHPTSTLEVFILFFCLSLLPVY